MPIRLPTAAALVALLAAGAPRPAPAQTGGITVDEVVRQALAQNGQILAVRARVDAVRARALSASGRFDTQLGARVGAQQQSAYEAGQTGLVPATSQTTSYTVEAGRLFRSGITLQPRVTHSRTAHDGVAMADNGSSVALAATVPLLRDRMGRASTAPERAMRLRADAGSLDVRHATAVGVHQAVEAYWQYAAAHARLGVYAEAEARAGRRLDETRTLVAGDERPAADLHPLEASLARARSQRILAEQAADEARAQLAVAMGMDAAAAAALPPPATPFPEARRWAPGAEEEARLVALALAERGDLIATVMELRSDGILVDGALEEMKPRLDLHLSVGYAGRALGNGSGGYFGALYRDVPGPNASLGIEYSFPVARTAARGASAEQEALRAEKEIAVRDLERRIAATVVLTARAVHRNAEAVRDAERAVELYRTTVENERRKSRLGASTLFDVTYAEDNLTSGELAEVAARLAYTRALVQLRMETGTLSRDTPDGPTVDAAALLTLP